MHLVDETLIYVRAGSGGNGAVSFRREKYIPKGGPDGGDGGKGGDVVLVGDSHADSLLPLSHKPHVRAQNGEGGMGKGMHGADGADLIVRVPLGTLVYEHETGMLLADIQQEGQRYIAGKGGKGGLGNVRFKTATHQTPRESTPGEEGQERTLRLELKLIADIGIIGLPNAGKSTLLAALSAATPKVADYPFTTLTPNVGVADLGSERRMVLADIPGLIEGAAQGAGLGHDFLKHVERTAALLHLVDLAPLDGSDPAANYKAIRAELTEYAESLSEKPELVVFNKIDLVPEDERDERIGALARRLRMRSANVITVSGATGQGMRELLEACWKLIAKAQYEGWSRSPLPAGGSSA